MKSPQKLSSGAFRTTVTLDGQRRSVTSTRHGCPVPTCRDCGRCVTGLADLQALAGELRSVRARVSVGLLTPEEARRVARGRELTVAEAWERMARTVPEASRKLVSSYWDQHLAVWFAERRLSELTSDVVAEWVQHEQAQGYASKTTRNCYDYLARAFRLLMPRELRELPWGGYRPPKGQPRRQRERCRSLDEFVALTQAAAVRDARRWDRGGFADLSLRLVVGGLCGLRQGEISGLAWHDVHDAGGDPDDPTRLHTVHVRRQVQETDGYDGATAPEWRPKDGVKEPIRLHPSAVVALRFQREQLERFGAYRPEGPVFPAPRAPANAAPHDPPRWRTHADSIRPEVFRAIVREAGLPDPDAWTPHSLRHTFATLELVAHGGDLRAVQMRTRHASLQVLSRYLSATGRGSPPSRLGAVPVRPPAMLAEPPAPAALPLPSEASRSALRDWVETLQPNARAFEDAQRAERRAERANAARPFLDLAREWLADGAPGQYPRAIADALRRAYVRGYSAARRRGGEKAEWQEAGRRTRRSTRAAWSSALKRAGGGAAPDDDAAAE